MFVHILHDQLIELYGLRKVWPEKQLVELLRHGLRLAAFLSDDSLLIPTSDLVQSPLARPLTHELTVMAEADAVYFVGSSTDIDQLHESKLQHFTSTVLYQQWQVEGRVARQRLKSFERSLQARSWNTTADVADRWDQDVRLVSGAKGDQAHYAAKQLRLARGLLSSRPSPTAYEAALEAITGRLDGHAFLWSVVENLGLFDFETSQPSINSFEKALAWEWARSHLDEYKTKMIGRLPKLGFVDCGLRSTHPDWVVDLHSYESALRLLGLDGPFRGLTIEDILSLRRDAEIHLLRRVVVEPIRAAGSTTPVLDLPELSRLVSSVREAAASGLSSVDAFVRAARKATSVTDATGSARGLFLL